MSKLSEDQVKQIRSLLQTGVSQTELARRYKVTVSNISNIHTNKTWKHIN